MAVEGLSLSLHEAHVYSEKEVSFGTLLRILAPSTNCLFSYLMVVNLTRHFENNPRGIRDHTRVGVSLTPCLVCERHASAVIGTGSMDYSRLRGGLRAEIYYAGDRLFTCVKYNTTMRRYGTHTHTQSYFSGHLRMSQFTKFV